MGKNLADKIFLVQPNSMPKSKFPKDRKPFCKTKDGAQVYRCWRWCGTEQMIYWFSLEKVQLDECCEDDFDVRCLTDENLDDMRHIDMRIAGIISQKTAKEIECTPANPPLVIPGF